MNYNYGETFSSWSTRRYLSIREFGNKTWGLTMTTDSSQPKRPPASPPEEPQATQPRFRRRQRKRRVRRSFMALFTVIAALILLVIGDRVALAVTENEMA